MQIGEDARQVAGPFNGRTEVMWMLLPISLAMMVARWSCPGRAARTAARGPMALPAPGCLNEYRQVGLDGVLAYVILQAGGPQARFAPVEFGVVRGYHSGVCHYFSPPASLARAALTRVSVLVYSLLSARNTGLASAERKPRASRAASASARKPGAGSPAAAGT